MSGRGFAPGVLDRIRRPTLLLDAARAKANILTGNLHGHYRTPAGERIDRFDAVHS